MFSVTFLTRSNNYLTLTDDKRIPVVEPYKQRLKQKSRLTMVSPEVLHQVRKESINQDPDYMGLARIEDIDERFTKYQVDDLEEYYENGVFDDACSRSQLGYGVYTDTITGTVSTVRFDVEHVFADVWVRSVSALQRVRSGLEYWRCISKIADYSRQFCIFTAHEFVVAQDGQIIEPEPGSPYVFAAEPDEIRWLRGAALSTYFGPNL